MGAEGMSGETRRRRALILCLLGAVVVAFVCWFFAQHGTHDLGIMFFGRCSCSKSGAVSSLYTIASVQKQFREGDREGDGFPDYATSLAELLEADLIDNQLATGRKSGYVFTLSGSTNEWNCRATPYIGKAKELRHNFIVCTDGVVRISWKEPATCGSPPFN